MKEQIFDAIVNGEPGIMLTISAKDLREVVAAIVSDERRMIDREIERSRESYCLTQQQVADKLNVHYNTVRRMVRRGELNPVRVGAKMRFRPTDIDRYLHEQAV